MHESNGVRRYIPAIEGKVSICLLMPLMGGSFPRTRSYRAWLGAARIDEKTIQSLTDRELPEVEKRLPMARPERLTRWQALEEGSFFNSTAARLGGSFRSRTEYLKDSLWIPV